MAQQFTASVTLSTDLTTVAYGFRPTYLRVDSATAGSAFISFSTVIATTASSIGYQLTSGAPPLVIDRPGQMSNNGMSSAFTAVSSSGGTAVVRILAVRI